MWTPRRPRRADHVARIIKADPVYQALPKGIYRTRTLTAVDHQSPTSLAIQRSCQQALEPEKTTRYQTSVEGSALDLAGEAEAQAAAARYRGQRAYRLRTGQFRRISVRTNRARGHQQVGR